MDNRIAHNLRKIRIEKGYTQEELANLLYVDRTTIVKYETGAVSPSVEFIYSFTELLDVSFDTLFK